MVRKPGAFTLVELLVAIAIIAILIALLLPAINGARAASRRMQCQGKMKQVTLAALCFLSANGRFPTGAVMKVEQDEAEDWCTKGPGFAWAPWSVVVLPFLEEQALYDRFDLDEPFSQHDITAPEPNRSHVIPLSIYLCPSDSNHRDPRNLNYYGVAGTGPDSCPAAPHPHYTNGLLFINSKVKPKHVTDGLSKTYLLGETYYADKWNMWWTSSGKSDGSAVVATVAGCVDPINKFAGADAYGPPMVHDGFSSYHSGGCHFALADGSLSFVNDDIDVALYRSMAVRDGGQAAATQPMLGLSTGEQGRSRMAPN